MTVAVDNLEVGHDRLPEPGPVWHARIADLVPARVNDTVYAPVDPADPEIQALAARIAREGLLEPIVVTADRVIVSGHRRRAACLLAGRTVVPARTLPITAADPRFIGYLTSYNLQRVKSVAEQAREAVVRADPESAYASLLAFRRERAEAVHRVGPLSMGEYRRRKGISAAKRPFLDAVMAIVDQLRPYWPVTDRQVHYQLLNDPPRRHAGKPGSRYANDLKSYKDLCDLMTRARLQGNIPWSCVTDETRPFTAWKSHANPGPFVKEELDALLRGYARNLLQSQPHHVEIVAEKMTVQTIVEQVAAEFCVPVSVGRGYSSIKPRFDMGQRFRASGKDRLVVLFLSDHDPEGENIAESFARSLRDDFGVEAITPIKVALTRDQVRELALPPVMKAKVGSSRRRGFVERHGENVFELEAVPPDRLQAYLRSALESVLDMEAFRAEEERERQDAVALDALRQQARQALAGAIES